MIESLAAPALLRAGLLALCAVFAATAVLGAVRPVFAEPGATRFTLANGMEVVVIPDHRAPVVTHMVWYRVGAADERPGKSGIAHFLEHLMFKGTKEIPPGEFSKIVARNGGEDNAFTSQDATAYFQRVAKDRLPLVMEMEADRMANLSLAEKEVLTERKVILEERRSRVDNDPASILSEQMLAALYHSHPYAQPVIGWEHEIRQLSHADATEFYSRYYAPNNAILVVAGDVAPDEVERLAKETYGKVKPRSERIRHARPREPRHAAAIRVRLEDPRAGRATLQRYYLTPSYPTAEPGEAEALDLLVKILASGTTSRLYKTLVVAENKAANAGGWYNGSALDSGRIGLYAIASDGVAIADVEAALDAVIADVLTNGISQKELDRARNAYIADHVYSSDSQSHLARRYGWALALGRSVADVQLWPQRLEKVTLDDVKRVARKYLDVTQSVTGVLVPVDKAKKRARTAADDAGKF